MAVFGPSPASTAVMEDIRPHVGGKFLYLGDQKFYVRGVTYGPFHPDADGGEYHVLLSLLAAGTVQAQSTDTCVHAPTIAALHECVQHATAADFIDNAGITTSLRATLDAAQTALDRGQPVVAVHVLRAFDHAVNVQAGKHSDAEHAAHLIMHAQMVMGALTT